MQVRGRDPGRRLAGHHLLLLPEGTRERAVAELVVAHHPGAATHPGEELRLGRHAALVGPLHLDAGAAAGAGVPAPWRLAWALHCPLERDVAAVPWTSDRDGLARAFPQGQPLRGERRAVDLLLGVARRLGGAVRVTPSDVVLLPDPHAWIDVVVYGRRLLPQQARAVLVAHAPGLELVTDGARWSGVRAEAMAHLVALDSDLTPAQRDQLHAAADRADAAALAAPAADPDDGAYGLALPLDADGSGSGGVVEVLVDDADEPPPALTDWGARASYRVRWWPPDEAAAEHEQPSADYVALRWSALAVVTALAGALVGAVDGVAVDAAGFPIADVG